MQNGRLLYLWPSMSEHQRNLIELGKLQLLYLRVWGNFAQKDPCNGGLKEQVSRDHFVSFWADPYLFQKEVVLG